MPKEQGERAPRMASKTAKDKSNSATLLATRAAKAQAEQEANGRGSRCSSEKDSGYSDNGSDSLQTDEDQHNAIRQLKARGSHQGSHQGNAMLMSGTPELAPIFIIKNVVLKQPVQAAQEHLLQAPLPWGSAGTNVQGPTVFLVQQPEVTSQAPMHILKPQPRRADSGSKKSKATYLPILNSYPRIAPHPSKKSDKTNAGAGSSSGGGGSSSNSSCSSGMGGVGGTAEDHCQSKRVCTEEKREEVSTTSQLPKQHVHKQPEGRAHSHGSHSHSSHSSHSHSSSSSSSSVPGRARELPPHVRRSPHPPSSPSTSGSLGSPSVSSTETASLSSSCELAAPPHRSSRGHHHNHHHHPQQQQQQQRPNQNPNQHGTSHGWRHRRFLNTVEILSQSGLLDITLRTQELLRQSNATERDIAQLRHHTQLLCQAAQACPASPDAWDRVHQAMAESGHYPSLKEPDSQCPRSSSSGSSHNSSRGQVQAEADTSSSSSSSSAGDGGSSTSSAKADVVVSVPFMHSHHEEMAPPSPLLALMDDLPPDLPVFDQNGHLRGQGGNDQSLNDFLMPPDSSTHSPLL
ncbi:CLOCK-interacting pacemaker [Alosa pseudoharengus]|uniref:CLOCK-interacting pacemaker n=1 Tax=Alosa pseudoharengus TaxID=34774 RepID=UPI003F88A8D7